MHRYVDRYELQPVDERAGHRINIVREEVRCAAHTGKRLMKLIKHPARTVNIVGKLNAVDCAFKPVHYRHSLAYIGKPARYILFIFTLQLSLPVNVCSIRGGGEINTARRTEGRKVYPVGKALQALLRECRAEKSVVRDCAVAARLFIKPHELRGDECVCSVIEHGAAVFAHDNRVRRVR